VKKWFDWIESISRKFWERAMISTSIPDDITAVYRIIFATYLLIFGTGSFQWLGMIPSSLFYPPLLSPAVFFTEAPPVWIALLYDLLYPTLLVGVAVGYRARLCGILASILFVAIRSFAYSYGKIDHDILTALMLLCFSFTNWSTSLALRPDRPFARPGLAIALFSVCLAFGLFTAGFSKAVRWIDFDLQTSGFLSWYLPGFYVLGRTGYLAPHTLSIPSWALEVGDYAVALIEITGLLFLLTGPRGWRFWLLMICFFHLSTTLFLNIPFTSHALIYLAFFLPGGFLVVWFRNVFDSTVWRPLALAGLAGLLLSRYTRVIAFFLYPPLLDLQRELARSIPSVTAVVVWLAVITLGSVAVAKAR